MNSSIPSAAQDALPKPSLTESVDRPHEANRRLADEITKAATFGLNRLAREMAGEKTPIQAP
jgi:hypothetical protein